LKIKHSKLKIRASPSSSERINGLVQEIDIDPLDCFYGGAQTHEGQVVAAT